MTDLPWLADHVMSGAVVVPAAALLDAVLEAGAQTGCGYVEELMFEAPLVMPPDGDLFIQVVVAADAADGTRAVRVFSRPGGDDGWVRCASGVLSAGAISGDACDWAGVWPPPGGSVVGIDGGYESLADAGYEYGPAFQGVQTVWRRGEEIFAEIAAPDGVDVAGFGIHPALLDAAFHPLVLTGGFGELRLPFVFRGVRLSASGASALRVRLTSSGDDVVVQAADATGQPVLSIDSLRVRTVPTQSLGSANSGGPVPHGVDWVDLAVSPSGDGSRWVSVGEPVPGIGGHRDLAELGDAIAAGEPAPDFVVFSCSAGSVDVTAGVRELTGRVLDVVQGWVGDERFGGSRLVVLTEGAVGVDAGAGVGVGVGVAGVVAGSVWGLVRSAQSEHPDRFVLVDTDPGVPDWALVAAGMAAGESQLALRDGAVLVPRLVRRVMAEPVRSLDVGPGTVLVTGGTGGLGALVAQRLVTHHGVRDLLLASRRGLDAPGATGLVSALEGMGAAVTVTACDVSDRAALATLLASIPADRPLSGVVHTAGVVDDATIEGLSAQRLDAVFAPKADAAWYLHELTRELPLSAFVLFSSLAAVVGNPGQGNYAAANTFLDTLAAHRHGLGLPAVSVAWGLWDTTDSSITGHLSAADLARLGRSGIAPLTVAQGLELFDTALGSTDALVVAAHWDTAGLRARAQADQLPPVLRGLVRLPRRVSTTAGTPAGASTALVQRLAALSEADAGRMLTGLVRSHVAAVLAHHSVDAVPVDRAFTELGFDSLTAVELRNRLNADTGLRLPATLVFDHPTVTALARYLSQTLAPAAPSAEDTLREALDRVESILTTANGDAHTTRTKLIAILHGGLARFGDQPTTADNAPDNINTASDEEIFALIDNEL